MFRLDIETFVVAVVGNQTYIFWQPNVYAICKACYCIRFVSNWLRKKRFGIQWAAIKGWRCCCWCCYFFLFFVKKNLFNNYTEYKTHLKNMVGMVKETLSKQMEFVKNGSIIIIFGCVRVRLHILFTSVFFWFQPTNNSSNAIWKRIKEN